MQVQGSHLASSDTRRKGRGFLFTPSVQFSSVTQSCPTLCDPMNRSTPGLPVLHQLPEFTQTHVHRVGDAIQPSHSRSSTSPPSSSPSHLRVFPNESTLCMRWPKYWSSSFNISPSNEHPELISFRMDWLNLLAVQGSLKSSLIMWVEMWAAYLDPVDQGMERIGLRFLPFCVSRLNQSSSVA